MALLLGFCGMSYAQKTVSGTISDAEGIQLAGASIVEQGTNNGAISDEQGRFSIQVGGNDAVLVVSYIGMTQQSITVGNNSQLNVTLQLSDANLDEVVITALGYKASKDEMGATYSTVSSEAINRSGEAMLLNSMAAKASNVQIQRSNGDPGAGTTIRIRGANTISGSSNPLIILDGVPISNSTIYDGGNDITGGRSSGTSQQSRLNDINPNDIESVQILKGASAASLWGSRAANGVIVITTKSGKSGRPKISYNASYSIDQVSERIAMQDTWGQGRNGSYSPTGAESWGDYIPDRSGGQDEIREGNERFVADNGTVYYLITTKNSQDTYVDSNWDEVFQTGNFFQQNLSISGGNDKATYFFSLGRLDQEGIIRNSDYDRTNLRLNNKFFLADWLNISSKAGYTRTSSNRIQQSSNVTGLLLGLLRTPPDYDISDYKGTYYNGDGAPFPNRHRAYRRYLGGSSSNPIYNNPKWTAFDQRANSDVDRFIMSTEINIEPASWLQFTLRGGVDNYNDARVYFFPIGSASDRNSGVFAEDLISERELNFDAIGKANFDLTQDIGFVATMGWNINDRKRRYNSTQLLGFLVNSTKETTDLNTAAENSTISNSKRYIRSNRGYGILSFDMYDQLYVNLSGSIEAASSVSGSFFYPSVDAAWQFTKILDPSDVLSFGKLRASWGKVGVQPQPHRFETPAESGFDYSTYSDPLEIALFGGGFRIDDDRGNPDLKPEIKTEWEIGTDLRFFQDRWSLNLTYYQNQITGILLNVALTPSSGFDTQYANAGEMENKGFELETDFSILKNDNWDLGIFANWSRNRNLVTDLQGTESIDLSTQSVSSRAIEGYPLGVLYGTGSQTDDNGNLILNENGFPQITGSPIVLGDPNPNWRGGIGLRAKYKGLGLNVLVEHSQGGNFMPRTLWVLRRFGTTAETANRVTLTQNLKNYAGDEIAAGTTVRGNIEDFGAGPVLLDETWYRTGIGGGFGDNQAYNFAIEDATFTRLREIALSYTLNHPAFQEKTRLGSIVLSAAGRNIFLWDDIEGIDPEINQVGVSNGYGLDYFTNPNTRSWVFSISINY